MVEYFETLTSWFLFLCIAKAPVLKIVFSCQYCFVTEVPLAPPKNLFACRSGFIIHFLSLFEDIYDI